MPPNADKYPPRYEEVGGWRHLIMDEPEWLARPSSWGIDKLPEPARGRKRELHDSYWYPRTFTAMAKYVQCEACRRVLVGVYDDPVFAPDLSPQVQSRTEWYQSLHPDLAPAERCAGWWLSRSFIHFLRGIINRREMLNVLLSKLHDMRFQVEHRSGVYPGERPSDHEWNRWISLELVGPNPFRPVAFAPEWRSPTAVALAEGMYAVRDFDAMPVLADALEEAGCDSPDVLGHCRGPGPHVRGCWVVDHVLGLG